MIVKAMTVLAGTAVVVQCICALNHMTLKTRNGVRVAYLALLMCAAASTLSPLYDAQPTMSDASLLLAVAVYIGVNRRRTYLLAPEQ